MKKIILLNLQPIRKIFFLLTTIFVSLFIALGLINNLKGGKVIFLELFFYGLCVSFFCTAFIFILERIRTYQENNFFKKEPFTLIEKHTLEREYIKERYSFYKLHRIFEIENIKYRAVFYSNVLKEIYGNALVIIKEDNNNKGKSILHIINYKEKKFDEKSLLEELKNI